MILYHGTSARLLNRIATFGLLPRSKTNIDNWKHSVSSSRDSIYLTDCYALHFAMNSAAKAEQDEDVAIIEVVSLEGLYTHADEDVLEQIDSRKDKPEAKGNRVQRTRYWRGKALDYSIDLSLKYLGTGAVRDHIPISRLGRVAVIKAKTATLLTMRYCDPVIAIVNHQLMGETYREFHRVIFDPTVMVRNRPFLPPDTTLPREGITIHQSIKDFYTSYEPHMKVNQ